MAHKKSDVKSELFLLEDKFTDKQSFTLKVETLKKNQIEAIKNNRRPCLRVEFKTNAYYILDELTFTELLNEFQQATEK